MSLGIFDRIWTLLEDACIELDIKLAECGDSSCGGSSFAYYVSLLKQRSLLKLELESQRGYLTLIDQMATHLSVTRGPSDNFLNELRKESANTRKSIDAKVKQKVQQKGLTIALHLSQLNCPNWKQH